MGHLDRAVLRELAAGDCLLSTLCQRTGLPMPVVDGVVTGLVSKGWADQSPPARSAAGVVVIAGRVSITPAGRRELLKPPPPIPPGRCRVFWRCPTRGEKIDAVDTRRLGDHSALTFRRSSTEAASRGLRLRAATRWTSRTSRCDKERVRPEQWSQPYDRAGDALRLVRDPSHRSLAAGRAAIDLNGSVSRSVARLERRKNTILAGSRDVETTLSVELIARLSDPPVDGELGQVLQMAAAGELY